VNEGTLELLGFVDDETGEHVLLGHLYQEIGADERGSYYILAFC